MISDQKILELWKSPYFSGSYRGIRTFQILLKTDLDIDVSQKRLYSVLKKDSTFLIHQKPNRKIDRRSYDLHNYGELVQADIAYMFDYSGYKYFLLAVDCYSSKVFTIPLKSKDSKVVAEAFKQIFSEFKSKIYEIQTDRGKEFLGSCKKVFKEEKILYKTKFGKNKASYAENYIRIVKKKLYMMLRGILNQNWVKYLSIVVDSLNNTPIKKLGWLKPNMINSEEDSVKVDEAKKAKHIETFSQPDFRTQLKNQKSYEANKKLFQVNDYIYLDFDEKMFDKSFDIAVRNINEPFESSEIFLTPYFIKSRKRTTVLKRFIFELFYILEEKKHSINCCTKK